MNLKKSVIFIACMMALTACESTKDVGFKSPDAGYKQAQKAYDAKDYAVAADLFSKLEQEFPYSKYTKDGLLKAAYAQFKTQDYMRAAETGKRYLELYPGSQETPYALHLVAMCSYNQMSDPRRDQAVTMEAKKYLQELVGRYPDSDYAIDGKIKLDFVNDQLAAKEMEVGRFYLEQQQVPAAMNRFKAVVKDYESTRHVQEALYRMVEGYLILGLRSAAKDSALLLGTNYPQSKWYHKAYDLMNDVLPEKNSGLGYFLFPI